MQVMRALAAVLACAVLAWPVSLAGWGMEVHRRLTRHAIDGLPAEIKPFFAAHIEFIAEHSVDPDLWRVVDLRTDRGEEDPNHFLDIDGLDEPRPFTGVPREWDAFVARYGPERANRMGRLPWRTDEVYRRLVAMFEAIGKGTPAYAPDNARYLAAVLAHYVQDAHQPFHAVMNYDGQLTNQRGIHSRFETELVLRHWGELKLSPVVVRPIPQMRDFIFETLVASEALVERVLAADRRAAAGRDIYDEGYFTALLRDTRTLVEQRLTESASAVASAIVSAWTAAGRPPLPLDRPRPPAPIRR
jgi:hypothetical protein